MSKKSTKKSDSKARTASAAVFFNENKSIAGFGNPLRAVFTSIRELVENALDAAEKRNVTPDIKMRLRRLSLDEVSSLMDIAKSRLKDKRLDFLQLSCKDNGVGVERELIPQLFGTVLAGTKYGAQQTRGRFGLGSKMVLLYSMSTLDLPIQITTRPFGKEITHRVKLLINLQKNQPIIVEDLEFGPDHPEYFEDFGTEIMVSFTGDWARARNYVKEYFRQLAIITPYADFHIQLPNDSQGEEDILVFKRVVDDLPNPPEVVRVHPWGTDVTTFRREMQLADPEDNVMEFLMNNFMGVSEQAAKAFFEEVGVDPYKKPSELTDKEVRRIVHDGFNRALRESKEVKRKRDRIFKFDDPKGDALSPLGADRLRKGIEKELEPLFVEALTRPPKAYEGHPFIIELALGYGGGVSAAAASKAVSSIDNKIVYRFANRIPLVFGSGNDVITGVVNQIKWSEYGLTRQSEPLAIAVSLVSTKIPFPETSKEYIDKVEEIEEEIKLAIMQLGRKLRSYLSRSRRRQRERQRRTRFERYAPQTVRNILSILEKGNLWDKYTGVQPERIIAALSSGDSRIGRSQYPRFKPLYLEPVWSFSSHVTKLQNDGIYLVEHFLRTPNNKLAKILKISQAKVDEIKRRTLLEGSRAGIVKDFNPEFFVNPEIEKRFHTRDSTLDFPRLSKAFPRRWIRNTWDYLVTPNDLLKIVGGYIPKLFEKIKLEIIHQSINEQMSEEELSQLSQLLDADLSIVAEPAPAKAQLEDTIDIDMKEIFAALEMDDPTVANQIKEELEIEEKEEESTPQVEEEDEPQFKLPLTLEHMIPSIDEILEHKEVKKRRISNKYELILEMRHPTNPIEFSTLADLFIESMKTALIKYAEVDASVLTERLDTKAPWLDGYTRNAFKRRKIATVKDFIEKDTEEMLDINELLRALMSRLEESLKKDSTLITDVLIEEKYEELVKALDRMDIITLEQLAYFPSTSILNDPNSSQLINVILEETKDELINSLISENSVFSLDYLKWIPEELEKELYDKSIDDINKLLRTPIFEFSKSVASRVSSIKSKIGTRLFVSENEIKSLNKMGVYCLEELVYSADKFYNEDLTAPQKKLLDRLTNVIFLPISVLSKELVRVEDLLIDVGINTVGRFLIWPNKELATITGFSEEWVSLIQEGFSEKEILKSAKKMLPLEAIDHLLFETEKQALATSGFKSIDEVGTKSWRILLPEIEINSEFIKIQKTLLGSVQQFLEIFTVEKEKKNLTKALISLEEDGIKTILDFLEVSPTHIISKVKGKKAKNALELLLIGIQSEEPESVSVDSVVYKAIKLFNIQEKLKLSPSHLSEFSNDDVESMITGGIRSIYQLLSAGFEDLSKLLGKSAKQVRKQFEGSKLRLSGTPLAKFDSKGKPVSIFKFEFEGVMHFSERDIAAILNSGYSTIEALYYQSDSRTFEVYGLSWEVIKHVKALFRSPSVLISWKEEIPESELPPLEEGEEDTRQKFKYTTLSSEELKKLSEAKQTRVLDFLTMPTDKLAKILGWDVETTKKKQTSTILQEVGIELEDVNLFRESDLKLLAELNISTVEDIYFSTFEDTWNESIIPWEAIKTIKNILKLPIQYVEEEISQEIVDLLINNDIPTILDFLLTGDPILSQKTGLPAERFENLKHALDFTTLVDTFDKSVCFIPDVDYYHAKKLIKERIEKVADFILAPNKTIAKLMEIKEADVKRIKANISRNSISEREREEGISLKDLKIFSRAEIRAVSKSGVFESREIKTAQELMYHVSESGFYSDPIIFRKIKDIQRVLQVRLERFSFISKDDLNELAKANIHTIEDIVFISVDVSYDPKLDPIISYLSNILMDLRPLIALGSLPASSASTEDVDGNLLDLWLNDDKKLNSEFKDKVYDILLLPLKSVRIGQLLHEITEDIENISLADACLAYGETADSPLTIMKEALSTKGSLISIMNEVRTPISVLDLSPSALRSLITNNITTVESLILKDVKFLSNLTGESQKFFREIASSFEYGKYMNKLKTYGIDLLRILTTDEDITALITIGIQYVEQCLSIKDQNVKEASTLLEFLLGSNIFLIGYPGELELTRNKGAQTVLESIVSLRMMGMDPMSILDITILGYRARYYYNLPLKKSRKFHKDNHILCVQDLVSFHNANPKVKLSKEDMETIELMNKTSLYLNVQGDLLEELIVKHRCGRIVDAISYPLIGDLLDEIREEYRETKNISIIEEVRIPLQVLRKISSTTFRRFNNTDLSLQEIFSYPRLIDEFKGLKKQVFEAANKDLSLPLTRIIANGKQIGMIEGITRLNSLLCYLPELYSSKRDVFDEIKGHLTSEISIIPDALFDQEYLSIISTAFGTEVYGFHELWAISTSNYQAIAKSDSDLSRKVRRVLARSFLSVSSIEEFTKEEVWKLWKNEIYTVAEFILQSAHIVSKGIISKKRYNEMVEQAIAFLGKKGKKDNLSLFQLAEIFKIQIDHVENSDLMTLYSHIRHPLVRTRTTFSELHFTLSQPIVFSKFIETLTLEDIKKLLQAGIFTIADFLVYPEGMDTIPSHLTSVEKRLELLSIGYEIVRKDLDIGVLDIPQELRQFLLGEGVTTLSRLISFYLNPSNQGMKSVFTSSLRYSKIDPADINKLASIGVETFLDLFIAPDLLFQDLLGVEENWAFERFIGFSYTKIAEKMENAFLPLNTISELSKKGVRTLNDLNYFSLFDVPDNLTESTISRNDFKVIQTLKQVVASPATIFVRGVDDKTIQETILAHKDLPVSEFIELEDKKIKKFKSELTSTFLLSLPEKGRSMSIIEAIRNPEQRLLKNAGYFTFEQVALATPEDLSNLGIDKDRAERIIKELNLPIDSIFGLDPKIIEETKSLGLKKVYEFLDDPRFNHYQVEKALILKTPSRIEDIFDGELLEYIQSKEISSVSELLNSKSFTNDIGGMNTVALKIVQILHSDIRMVKDISDRWYNNLNSIGVKKVWQFYTKDEEEIGKAVNVSVMSIIDSKNSIKLTEDMISEPDKLAVKSDIARFIDLGLRRLSDFQEDIIFFDLFKSNKEIYSSLQDTVSKMSMNVWEIPEFWNLSIDMREHLAKVGVEKVHQIPGEKTEYVNFINTTLKTEKTTITKFEELKSFVGDGKTEIDSFQHWFYLYHGKERDSLFNGVTATLRFTIDRLQGMTSKTIIRAKHAGISHISDLVELDPDSFSKLIGLTGKNKINEFRIDHTSNGTLYPIGLFPESKIAVMKERFTSWLAVLGNCLENDFHDLKGITKKSFNTMMEVVNTPIRLIEPIRNLGLPKVKRLKKLGISSLSDMLICKPEELMKELNFNINELNALFKSITRATINKSLNQKDIPLSVSRKIRVSDLDLLKEHGIDDIKQVILKEYKLPKNSPVLAGVQDIERIMIQPVDEIPWKEETILALKKHKIKQIGELVFLSDSMIRQISKVSNVKLKEFRKKLPRKPGRIVNGKAPNTAISKKSDTKKTSAKKATAKKTSTKKATAKKTSTKKATTKKAVAKKKSSKKGRS